MKRIFGAVALVLACVLAWSLGFADRSDARVIEPVVAVQMPATVTAVPVPRPPPRVSDYAGHETWCAPTTRPLCASDRECPAGTRCIRPYYGRDRVCTVPYPTKSQQRIRRKRLNRVGREIGLSWDARLVVRHVVSRESTYRPRVVHGRDPDVRSAWTAWSRPQNQRRYRGNVHYLHARQWSTVGQFAMNSTLWVWEWDPLAPPSVLCLESVSVEAYARRMRRVWHKYNSGSLACAKGQRATWWDLTRAASSGKVCPSESAKLARIEAKFARFMRRKGSDPYRRPRLSELGTRREGMAWARSLEQVLDEHHPYPRQ